MNQDGKNRSMVMARIVSILEQLVAFDTQNPPRQIDANSPIFTYIQSVLPAGFSLEITDHGLGRVTVYAKRGNPTTLFNVHLDTVPVSSGWTYDPFKLKVFASENKAIGLGACDIKGAAACLLALAELDDRDVAFLFTTDEEGADGYCVQAFTALPEAKKYTQVIVAEPTQCKALLSHAGYISFVGSFQGVAGHSSNIDAFNKSALHACTRWASNALDWVQSHYDLNQKARFNIGRIEGGVKSNVTADHALVRWSARLSPRSDSRKFISEIQACAPVGAQIEWSENFYGIPLPDTDHNTDQAQHFIQSHKLEGSGPAGFWTEAALFHQAKIAAIVLGPGDIKHAHTADEEVSLNDLEQAYAIYERLSR